ncbi:MAG: hypothetical protein V3V08_01720 [Nannocystaceae bacterium]
MHNAPSLRLTPQAKPEILTYGDTDLMSKHIRMTVAQAALAAILSTVATAADARPMPMDGTDANGGQSPSRAPSMTLSASAETGDPGDKITFTWSYNTGGDSLDRLEIKLDGASVDDTGSYVWTATPGSHVFRAYIRTASGGDKQYRHALAVVNISGWETSRFSHPGLTLTGAELDVIKENVFGDDSHPMKSAWGGFSPNPNHTPNAREVVNMKDSAQKADWDKDTRAVYPLALKWAISGDAEYGDAAVRILNDYGSTCRQLWYDDIDVYPFLHSTHLIHDWALAAELLKHYDGGYEGWAKEDIKIFDEGYMRQAVVPITLGWWGNVGNPYSSQNQPLNVAKARIMVGIYLDDAALYQSGYDHFLVTQHGPSYGGTQYKDVFGVDYVHLMELSIGLGGEYLEINRDEEHMGMCVASTQMMAETLCHQGEDVYDLIIREEETPRFLQGVRWLTEAALGGGGAIVDGGHRQSVQWTHRLL